MPKVVTATIGDLLRDKPRFSVETTDRRRRRLSAIAGRHADRTRPFLVALNRARDPLRPFAETLRSRKEWRDTYVGPNDVVTIIYLTRGGSAGGASGRKQVGMAVAAIALVVVATLAAGPIGSALATSSGIAFFGTSAGVALLQAGIVLGGTALISLAMRSKANKQAPADTRPLYGVGSGGNLPRPGDRRQVLYGRRWIVPDLTQPNASIYEGDDMIGLKRLHLTEGEAAIHAIRFGNQLVWTEEDGFIPPFTGGLVEWEEIYGTPSALVPNDIISSSAVAGLPLPRPGDNPSDWAGPFPINPDGELVTRLQVDYTYTSGISANFTFKERQIQGAPGRWGVHYQYAPIDEDGNITGAWQDIVNESYLTAGERLSTRPLRETRFKDVPPGRYAVQGRNIMPTAPEFTNDVSWDGARGWAPDARVRENRTEIAFRIRSAEQLQAASFGEIEIEATRLLPTWDGLAWTPPVATRKAVWAFADIRRNPIYGAASPDSRLDLAGILHYATAAAPFDEFNEVVRGPVSNWEAMANALFPMRAEPVNLGRIWTITRDEPRALTRRHNLTARQIGRGSTRVAFDLENDDGSAHQIIEFDRGGDHRQADQTPPIIFGQPSLTPLRRRVAGIRTYEHALHIGRWLAASAAYRRQIAKIETEHDARIFKRGDPAAIDVWFMDGATRRGVVSRAGDSLEFDADIPFVAGDVLTLRDRTGREWGPVTLQSQGASPRHLVLNGASRAAAEAATGLSLGNVLATGKMQPTTARIGAADAIEENYLIRTATPAGPNRIRVEAVIDDDRVWTAIGAVVAPRPPSGTVMVDPDLPVVPRLDVRIVIGSAGNRVEWAGHAAVGAVAYQVQISYDGGVTYIPLSTELSGQAELPLFEGSTMVNLRIRAQGAGGLWGNWTYGSAVANPASLNLPVQLDAVDLGEQFLYEHRHITEPQLPNSIPDLRDRITDILEKISAIAALAATQGYLKREETRVEHGRLQASYEQTLQLQADENLALAGLTTTLRAELAEEFGVASVAEISTGLLAYATETEAAGIATTSINTRIASGDLVSATNLTTTLAGYATDTEAAGIAQTTIDSNVTSGNLVSSSNLTSTLATYATEDEALAISRDELTAQRGDGRVLSNANFETYKAAYATENEALAITRDEITVQKSDGRIISFGNLGFYAAVYTTEEEALTVVQTEMSAQRSDGRVLSNANFETYKAAYATETEALTIVRDELTAQRSFGNVLSTANFETYKAAYATESEALAIVRDELGVQRSDGTILSSANFETYKSAYATETEAGVIATNAATASFNEITANGLIGMAVTAGPYGGSSRAFFRLRANNVETGLSFVALSDGTSQTLLKSSQVFFVDPNVDGGVPKQYLTVSAGVFRSSSTFFKIDGQLITGIQRSATLSSDAVNPVMRADWDSGRLEVYD